MSILIGSPTDLSSRPVKVAIADEIDRMGLIRKEGDPLSLIHARQQTFASRKLYAISTPTVVGHSRVEQMMGEANYFEWHSRCEHCGEHHSMRWDQVRWEPGKPEGATYEMPCCGAVLNDAERWRFGAAGRWVQVQEGKQGWKAYRFNGLVSPWVRLAELASQFEAAKGLPSKLQPFFNLKLGVAYEADIGEGPDHDVVTALAETWKPGTIPAKRIVLLTAGVDVQQTWLAVQIVGWSEGDEAWTLAWHEIPGDPLDTRTWEALAELLLQPWQHPSGDMMSIEAVAVDSGYQPQAVYEFSAKYRAQGRRWYSVKGIGGADRPMWQRGNDVHRSLSKIFIVGTHVAKSQIAAGLITTADGHGRWHTPKHVHEQAPHFAQWFCAEHLVTKETASGSKQEWQPRNKSAKRNEALDTAVYALAARYSSDFRIEQRIEAVMATGQLKPKQVSWADLGARAGALSGATNA